jgi:hypothetical protein
VKEALIVLAAGRTRELAPLSRTTNTLISECYFFICFFLKLWLRLSLEKSEPMDDDLDKIKNNNHTVFFRQFSVHGTWCKSILAYI